MKIDHKTFVRAGIPLHKPDNGEAGKLTSVDGVDLEEVLAKGDYESDNPFVTIFADVLKASMPKESAK